MSNSIEEIVSIIGATRMGERQASIAGHKYIPELYARGVYNFVVTEVPEQMKNYTDVNFLVVGNVLKALQRLASKHREQYQVPVVGITGSNGKTVRIGKSPVLHVVIIRKSVFLYLFG